MARAKVNRVFKVSMITHDVRLYDNLMGGILGKEFDASYSQTKGANFAYTKISVPGSSEGYLMAQLWMLHPDKQWVSVRQLYYSGSSGLVLVVDPKTKNYLNLFRRLMREFMVVNKGQVVPILVIGVGKAEKEDHDRVELMVSDIERWSGQHVAYMKYGESDADTLKNFILTIRNSRTKAKILTTLNMYFALDSISKERRQISQIIKHLRSLKISSYFSLIPDDEMMVFIREVAAEMFFKYDGEDIVYRRAIE